MVRSEVPTGMYSLADSPLSVGKLYQRTTIDHAPRGKLCVVPNTSCLSNEANLHWNCKRHDVITCDDVVAVGFRTYIARDNYLFNDQTLQEGFDKSSFVTKILRQNEDLKIEPYKDLFRIILDRTPRNIEYPIFSLLSDEPSNYGSWIYRIIPKLLDWKDFGCLPLLVWNNKKWMVDLINIALNKSVSVINYTPSIPYNLKAAVIPFQRNHGVRFDTNTLDLYKSISERYVNSQVSGSMIYLARGMGKRQIANESEVINLLSSFGFQVYYPGAMSVSDQIQVIANAEYIVCAGGAGLFNLVFARQCKFVVDIEPGVEWVSAHQSLISSCGLDHVMLFGERLDNTNPHSNWNVHIEDLRTSLIWSGLPQRF